MKQPEAPVPPQAAPRQGKSMNIIERFWTILGGSTALLFGRESASAMSWMLIALSARFLVQLFRLDGFVPIGILFASPYVLQVINVLYRIYIDFIYPV